MINGRVNRLMEAARLEADRELQQRLLGVGQHGEEEQIREEIAAAAQGEEGYSACETARADPGLHFKSDSADALVAAGTRRPNRKRRAHAHHCA